MFSHDPQDSALTLISHPPSCQKGLVETILVRPSVTDASVPHADALQGFPETMDVACSLPWCDVCWQETLSGDPISREPISTHIT